MLNRDRFEIREDGKPQPIAHFQYGIGNLAIALAVDNSGSMRPRWIAVQRSVAAFLTKTDSRDEGALLIFDERVDTLIPLGDEISPLDWSGALQRRFPTGKTSLYDAVIQSSRELLQASHDRRVIVVLSDGKDTASQKGLETALNELRSSNRILYAVGLFKPGEPDTDASVLRKLAEATGGTALFIPDMAKLDEAFEQILADLRARYLIGYYAGDADRSGLRKLSVTVRDEEGHKLRVKSRSQYRIGERSN
jgi:VWFA-related protein